MCARLPCDTRHACPLLVSNVISRPSYYLSGCDDISTIFVLSKQLANSAQLEPSHFLVCANVSRPPVSQQMRLRHSLLVRRSNSILTWRLFTICPPAAPSKSRLMGRFLTPRPIRQPLPWDRRWFTTATNWKSPLMESKPRRLSEPSQAWTSVPSSKAVAPEPRGPTP